MISWTGRGWVGALLWFSLPAFALWLAFSVAGDTTAAWVVFAVVNVVVGVPVHVLVGRRLNTTQTPQGPQRHADHSLMHLPVQRAGWFYVVLSLIALGAALHSSGHTGLVWPLGIAGFIGLCVYYGWASREYRAAAFDTSSPDGALIAARAAHAHAAPQPGGGPTKRERSANPEYREELAQRWAAYGEEVGLLTPAGLGTGTVNGLPFTVFDTMIKEGGWRDQYASMRTVCAVQLPVALPDVRLRPRLLDEAQLGELPAVALEPPWNCDLLIGVRAIAVLESGADPTPELTAEADVPGFAEALVTPSVVAASVRHGLIRWRVHGRDLIYVSFPGPGFRLTAVEAMAVVTGLAEIAHAFQPQTLQRYVHNPQ